MKMKIVKTNSGLGHNEYVHFLKLNDDELQETNNLPQNPPLQQTDVMGSIFLIEKGWIDPMENRNADGYEPFGFKLTEQEAKNFCELHGYWTDTDCWSIQFKPNKVMSKYRYKEIQYCP